MKKMKNQRVVLFKTPIMTSPLSHFTPRTHPSYRVIEINYRVIEINALSHLLNPKRLGRGKDPFFEGTPANRSSGDVVGPVAQRIRARGYEPRCRGFESLLAHNRPKGEVPFPLGVE
jgi:hypothetical protein